MGLSKNKFIMRAALPSWDLPTEEIIQPVKPC